VKRLWALIALVLLAGCREVRVQTFAQGSTTAVGSNQFVIARNAAELERFGIKAPIHYRGEFGVLLLMGPHQRSGYRQVVESIRASDQRVRVVAFEEAPADGGEPALEYRTYTLWIIPNSVYRRGIHVDAVTPSNEPIASMELP
jgi:hypothetical protein